MEFEDILKQVGDFGRFQKCLVYLFLIPVSTLNILYDRIFMWTTPDHWCRVPQLTNISHELQKIYIRPKTTEQGLPSYDKCRMYDIDYDLIGNFSLNGFNQTNDTMTKKCQNGWLYDQSIFEATAVTEFGLVCDNAYYVSLIMSLGPIGTMVGTPLLSFTTDRIGRRHSFLYITIILVISLISPIFLRDIISFAICFVLESSLFVNFYQVPYIMVMEFVGTDYRTRISSLSAIAYSIGGCILPILAFVSGDWVWLAMVQLVITLPIFVFWRYLPESVSWLISQKRYEEAVDVMSRVAQVNGQSPPEDLLIQIQKMNEKQEELKSRRMDSTKDFIKVPELRKRLLILIFLFMANVLAYNGLALNSLNFHGNELINYFFLSLADIPAALITWYLIEGRLGRRWTNALALTLSGISLCVPILLRASQKKWITGMSLLGKGGTAASFIVMYQQAAEIFPTTLRSEGLGVCSTFGSFAAFIVPYITYLGSYGLWIPMFVMGTTSLVAAIASTFLPETLNENLPQNSSESQMFGKNKPFFSLALVVKETKL